MTISNTAALSILDLMPVTTAGSVSDTTANTLDLARRADSLAYQRYWLTEHHSMPSIASSAPAVMIGLIAERTTNIRVGSGGVMLPNHPPLVVAEQFGTLDALFPGRIDLGVGRAPGTDPVTAHALRRDTLSENDFPEQFEQLRSFVSGTFPHDHPYRAITAVPGRGAQVALWLLGTGLFSAQLAGSLGLPFAFARHIAPSGTQQALDAYRNAFVPSPALEHPYVIVTATVLAADTDSEAHRLAGPQRLMMARLRSGNPIPVPSPEFAESNPLSDDDRALISGTVQGSIVGSAESVADEISELADTTGAQEIMISTVTFDHSDRVHSYELVADRLGKHRSPVAVGA